GALDPGRGHCACGRAVRGVHGGDAGEAGYPRSRFHFQVHPQRARCPPARPLMTADQNSQPNTAEPADSVDRYVVVGNPISHSRSPAIYAAFARQTGEAVQYDRLEAPLDAFADTMREFL